MPWWRLYTFCRSTWLFPARNAPHSPTRMVHLWWWYCWNYSSCLTSPGQYSGSSRLSTRSHSSWREGPFPSCCSSRSFYHDCCYERLCYSSSWVSTGRFCWRSRMLTCASRMGSNCSGLRNCSWLWILARFRYSSYRERILCKDSCCCYYRYSMWARVDIIIAIVIIIILGTTINSIATIGVNITIKQVTLCFTFKYCSCRQWSRS